MVNSIPMMVDDATVNDRRPGDTCRLSRSAITLACIVCNWLAKSTIHVRILCYFCGPLYLRKLFALLSKELVLLPNA